MPHYCTAIFDARATLICQNAKGRYDQRHSVHSQSVRFKECDIQASDGFSSQR